MRETGHDNIDLGMPCRAKNMQKSVNRRDDTYALTSHYIESQPLAQVL